MHETRKNKDVGCYLYIKKTVKEIIKEKLYIKVIGVHIQENIAHLIALLAFSL